MEADFSGYATKAGLKCSDGRTIMPGAFKHQDKMRVPLVWQHGHTDPENVLGHAILENREDGVYAYGYFNDSVKAKHTHGLVEHGDVTMLSIWANELVERASRVIHGAIREVSLVLSGANPGALIENVTIRHSNGDETILDEEVIIYTGLEFDNDLEHSGDDKKDEEKKDDLEHAGDEETLQDVYDSLDDKQKQLVHFMLGEALDKGDGGDVKQDNLNSDNDDKEGKKKMNVFEKDDKKDEGHVLSHEDVKGIVADAMKGGSLKEAVENYALAHGITEIEVLFPEATQLTAAPEWFTRRMEWVAGVLAGARKTPFSRIKTATADLTFDDARAKGYIKGNLKKEQFFATSRRITTPQTVYKKQKLDRDDIIDITDFDVVAWMKGEMRVMLDEELARAILIGDGRDPGDDDKIQETFIRPIISDDEFYTITLNVNIEDASSSVQEIVDSIVMGRQHYRGTGTPDLYTTETVIAKFLLLKDTLGRRIYTSLDQVAAELRVGKIIPVEVLDTQPDVLAIIVNMADYVIGADKGGQVAMFDDFDIDYNQYKYLIETRISGALVRPKSAMVVRAHVSTDELIVPNAPTFDGTDITIVDTANVVYTDQDDNVVTSGATVPVAVGETVTITATADSGYYFASSEDDTWAFTNTGA